MKVDAKKLDALMFDTTIPPAVKVMVVAARIRNGRLERIDAPKGLGTGDFDSARIWLRKSGFLAENRNMDAIVLKEDFYAGLVVNDEKKRTKKQASETMP